MHTQVAKPEHLSLGTVPSPLGPVNLVTDERGVLRLLSFGGEDGLHRLLRPHYGTMSLEPGEPPPSVRDGLTAYFDGDLDALGRIPWETGGTPFQRSVWAALTTIPAGTTMTYGALAAQIGAPRAVRAVGHANGANPISLVVPCHRLIGASGALTGYGGGLERKRWLLEHEGARLAGEARRRLPAARDWKSRAE